MIGTFYFAELLQVHYCFYLKKDLELNPNPNPNLNPNINPKNSA